MERLTEWKPHRLALTPGDRRELLALTKRGTSADEPVVIEAWHAADAEVTSRAVGQNAIHQGIAKWPARLEDQSVLRPAFDV